MSMMGEGISSQVDGEKQTRKKMVYLSSRCGVQEFSGLVESLSDDKKKVILDMGFGGLLHLKRHKLKMQLLEDLMMRFNVTTSQLSVHGNRLTLSVNDVVTIFGLHDGGMNVETQLGEDDEVRFVYDGLLEGIKDYQNKSDGASRDQHVTGCVLLLKIFYLEHVNMHNLTRHSNSLPRIRHWDEKSISKIVNKVSSLGGVDCIQVGFGGDASSCFKIEDIKVEIGLLRNEFQKDMHSTKSQLGELKKEMSDAMSQIITTLGTVQSQLQSGGPKIIIEDEPTTVHVFTRKQEEVRIDANDNIELSDDASSPLQLSKAKRNHLGKQGNKTTDAIPSQNEKKRKANQHEEDETDSFERLMAGVDQKVRSREDSNMGLRKKDVLKAGPQFQFPYVAAKPAVINLVVAGLTLEYRDNKESDHWFMPWSFTIYLPICEHEHWYLAIVNMEIKGVYLLDSYALKDDSSRKDNIRQILSVLDEMLHHDNFEAKVKKPYHI
ncbi:unnamed protein product [Linum trigynum]|uniref:Ubiquitin-like protease family profile domain-containing protein n=1 Tax=Linum trigynum TaxID=586398 RepID=A0AAV2CH57_9ROSI